MEFEKLAERWIALVGSTSEEALAEKFEYTHRSGAVRKKVRSEMLLHGESEKDLKAGMKCHPTTHFDVLFPHSPT